MDNTPGTKTVDEATAGWVREQVVAGTARKAIEERVVADGFTDAQASEVYNEIAAVVQDHKNIRTAWEAGGGSP